MPEDTTVMIVDGGARGHVLSEAYERDPRVKRVIVAPGNDFVGYKREKEVVIAKEGALKNPQSLLAVAQKYIDRDQPHVIDVAQDDALALGTVDLLSENGFTAFGSTAKAAQIESDKVWSRKFMRRNHIPSPSFKDFTTGTEDAAIAYVNSIYGAYPDAVLFVKAAGLCGGKGALRAGSYEEAVKNIKYMREFGEAGAKFLVEDAILNADGTPGEEFSYIGISDGISFLDFESSQDNKRELDDDKGEQTGGMGANSPAYTTANIEVPIQNIMHRAIRGMAAEGNPFTGNLYLGGMVTDGAPWVVEFNARFGDPEIQTIIPGVRNYPALVLAALSRELHKEHVQSDGRYRVCVVGAALGYPDGKKVDAVKGKEIYGLQRAAQVEGVKIYGAGIVVRDNKFYAGGGRLFSAVGEGINPLQARDSAYEAMSYISIEGGNLHFRRDIGRRDVDRFSNLRA